MMGGEYPYVLYEKDSSINKWTMKCFKSEKDYNTRNGYPRLILEFDTSKDPYTVLGTVNAMDSHDTLVKGKDYVNEFGESSTEGYAPRAVTLDEAATVIPTITESSAVKLSGTYTTEKLTALVNAINSMSTSGGIYFVLDFSTVTGFTEIPENAFNNCKLLTGIIIPSTVTKINDSAFANSGLVSIEIPDSVTQLGTSTFSSCADLRQISFGSGITTLSANTLSFCTKLDGENISFGAYLKTIEDRALNYMSGVKKLVIPDSVETIGNNVFEGNQFMEEISIGKNVSSIGSEVFESCIKLRKISVADGNNYFETLDDVLFTKGKETLVQYPAYKENAVYTVPDGVKTIGRMAFTRLNANLDLYSKIIVPDSVETIERDAFYNAKIKSVVLGNGVKFIKNGAFCGCQWLEEVNIPVGVEEIGDSAFSQCYLLTEVLIPSSVKTIGKKAFNMCKKLESLTINADINIIKERTFYQCTALKSINIPKSVTEIENSAFNMCSSLETVSFEDNSQLKIIGASAFSGCSSIKVLVIPDSVEEIGVGGFAGLSSLEDLTIGSNVKIIDKNGFVSATSLKSVTIPSSVTKIGQNAFSVTKKNAVSILESVTFSDTTGSWYATSSTDYTGGEKIEGFPSSTDKAANATALNTTYKGKYLYKVSE